MKKNVILLGGSNSVMVNGLQKGLREGIDALNASNAGGGGLEFYNFALGGTENLQRLFALIKEKPKIENADLIILESNVNDFDLFIYNDNLEKIFFYYDILCRYLANLNTKILIILLPLEVPADQKDKLCKVNNYIRAKNFQYQFNFIDMQNIYEQHQVNTFFETNNRYHQIPAIMHELGKNIITNLKQYISNKNACFEVPGFIIKTPEDLFENSDKLIKAQMKNSLIDEEIYELQGDIKLKFKNKFKDFKLLSFAVWNSRTNHGWNTIQKIFFQNTQKSIIKALQANVYLCHTLWENFILDEQSFLSLDKKDNDLNEPSVWLPLTRKIKANINYCAFSYFFLSKNIDEFEFKMIDYENFLEANSHKVLRNCRDFSHLVPDIVLFKNIIEEYCARMDPRKLAPLQNQINDLNSKLKNLSQEKENLLTQISDLNLKINSIPHQKQVIELENLKFDTNIKKLQVKKLEKELGLKLSELEPKLIITQDELHSAKARVHKHLAYKLGLALIINSKSLLGYLRMPFILSYIKAQHNFELEKYQKALAKNPNLKLPALESYKDYKEALQEKQCFTYKLGLEFIKASRTWYKGGYIRFYFESKRLKREFKGKI